MSIFSRVASDRFLKTLDNLSCGSLALTMPDGHTYHFKGAQPGPHADLVIEDAAAIAAMAADGDNGLAEAYQRGWWHSNDLASVLILGMLNEKALKTYFSGNWLSRRITRLAYLMKSNSRKGSRKNVHAHYDLGNDFYSLWLDPTMTYSSALFKNPGDDLVQAQNNKYDRLIGRLGASSGSLLEIGCGWGGFADRAMSRGDFDIKALTLSKEQYDYAADRLRGNARVMLGDYRDLRGKFDNIVSIEMFEAVGERYWPIYFQRIGGLLKRGGKAMIQTITIDDARFEKYRRGTDVIRSAIFPGGMLPGPRRFRDEAARGGLRVNDEFHFGHDYAHTLKLWLNRFDAQQDAVQSLGFNRRFIRLWRFYLAYCIAGFRTNRISVMQVELQHA